MALLPTPEKSWQRVFNVDSGTDRKKLLLDKKNILCGVAFSGQQITQNAWHVVRSSNGTTVANSDLWSTTADINQGNAAGTNARSWIILQNALGRQWLWDYRGNDSSAVFLSMSPTGAFTGGTTTSAPTAPDALTRDPLGASSTYDIGAAGKVIQNVMISSDGKQTVILTNQPTDNVTIWLFGDLEDPVSDWAHPCIMWADACGNGASGQLGDHLVGFSGGVHITAEETIGVLASLHFVGESLGSTPLHVNTSAIKVKNQVSNIWDCYERCWVSSLREASWGQLGYWPDLWIAPPRQTGFTTGDHMPADGSRLFVKFSDLIFSWGGAAAMVIS